MKPSLKIIAWILTLCGISLTCTACYGVPHDNYRMLPDFEGTVVSRENNQPIAGIRVTVRPYATESVVGSAITDQQGNYSIEDIFGPLEKDGFRIDVVAEDIDGDQNGGRFVTSTKNVPVWQVSEQDGKRPGNSQHVTVDFQLQPDNNQ